MSHRGIGRRRFLRTESNVPADGAPAADAGGSQAATTRELPGTGGVGEISATKQHLIEGMKPNFHTTTPPFHAYRREDKVWLKSWRD